MTDLTRKAVEEAREIAENLARRAPFHGSPPHSGSYINVVMTMGEVHAIFVLASAARAMLGPTVLRFCLVHKCKVETCDLCREHMDPAGKCNVVSLVAGLEADDAK